MQNGELRLDRKYQPDTARMLDALLLVLSSPTHKVTNNSDSEIELINEITSAEITTQSIEIGKEGQNQAA